MNELKKVEARIAELTARRDRINAELLDLGKRKSLFEVDRDMAARIAKFSDAEKAALFQSISPKGIPSGETVGAPTT
jgi:hypothetical protein